MIKVMHFILCIGSGTRLRPLSRTGFPKQFLCLSGKQSLSQQAAVRLTNPGNADLLLAFLMIVTGEDHYFLAAEQLREIGVELGSALLEPVGRNTAPALTLVAFATLEGGADPVLVVTPADQTVVNAAAFTTAMQRAVTEAANGTIVTLSVTAEKLETGYGYIQVSQTEANAGMFVLRASLWLKVLEQLRLDILQATQVSWHERSSDNNCVHLGKAEFNNIPSESIDCAALECCPGRSFPIKMVPLDAGWNDLGAWDAVCSVLPKDEAGNAHLGYALTTDSRNTLVHATSRLVSVVGIEDLIVVKTPDAVLVACTAEITNGDKVLTLTDNQSIYIPLGEVHRLANLGTIPLEIIEVQSGSYLGEYDIVHFEDTYRQAKS